MLSNERIESSYIQKVDSRSIKNEDSRSFGCEWMAKQVIEACGFVSLWMKNKQNRIVLESKPRAGQTVLRQFEPTVSGAKFTHRFD
jgi:hypothetical protein